MKKHIVIVAVLLLAGCASTPMPVQQIEVTYKADQYGVPVPMINGIPYPMTENERKAIGRAFINGYCK